MLHPFKRWRKPQPPPPESLSQADYEHLVRDLAAQASQGASWPQLLATLQNRGLSPEQVAQWMTQYGGKWVKQPETEFGHGLLRLSEVAEGSLAEITKILGQAITQGPEPPPPAVELSATSESTESTVSAQNPETPTNVEPDPTVLAEIEAYLRGDFSLADLNPTPTAGQSFTPEISQPTPTAPFTDPLESVNPSPTPQINSPTASHCLKQAQKLYLLRRYEEALASLDQALSLQSDLAMAWNGRGSILASLGRYKEALASYDQAVTRQTDLAAAWVGRGIALYKLRHCEEALDSYDQAVTLEPGFAEAWSNRGITLYELGHYEKALASYDRVITLNPSFTEAWFLRGDTLRTLEHYEEALASYDRVITLNPSFAEAWKDRGMILHYRLKRYEEALASYDQALNLQPENPRTWANRGALLHNQLGHYEEALASHDQAITLQPDLAIAWFNRGVTLGKLERSKERLESYDYALSLQPDLTNAWIDRGIAVAHLSHYQPEDESLFRLKIQQELDSRSRCALTSFFNRDVDAIRVHVLKSLGHSKTQLLQTFADTDNPQLLALIQQPPSPELETVIAAPISAELQFLVNQPVLPGVLQKITEDAARSPSRFCPELQVGGYQGQLNSYRAELGEHSQDEPKKAICKDTHPEGWGTLHRAIGQAHYFEGRQQVSPRPYWRKAANSFKRALETLRPPQFETLYFETLQDLIRALLGIGETQEAEALQQEATDYIRRVLAEADHRHDRQQQLGLWLAKFQQLTVDAAIQAGDFPQALSTAEIAKNVCLRWLLDLDEVPDVTFAEMQALVDEHTAMVYWHLSPSALTTFLLLPGASEPVVIPPPDLAVDPTQALANDERPLGLKQMVRWEDWLSQWNQDYDNYSSAQNKTDKQPAGALSEVEGHNFGGASHFEQPPKTVELTTWRRGHPWRTQMASRLTSLGQLLNVEAIHAALQGYPIQRLRLIPHRDLHRFPLHTFFDQYDCTQYRSVKLTIERNRNS